MTLLNIIRQLNEYDDTAVIYARPKWGRSTPAVVAPEPADGGLPPEAAGMSYMLTVQQAKEVAKRRRRGRPDLCAPEALCDAIVYFAVYDEVEPLPSFRDARYELATAV